MNETQKENVFSRYHHSIFLPDSSSELLLEFFDSFDKVNITKHALAESYKDKKAYIIIPNKSQLLSNQSYLIEIYIPKENGVELGYIQKAVIRVKNLSP